MIIRESQLLLLQMVCNQLLLEPVIFPTRQATGGGPRCITERDEERPAATVGHRTHRHPNKRSHERDIKSQRPHKICKTTHSAPRSNATHTLFSSELPTATQRGHRDTSPPHVFFNTGGVRHQTPLHRGYTATPTPPCVLQHRGSKTPTPFTQRVQGNPHTPLCFSTLGYPTVDPPKQGDRSPPPQLPTVDPPKQGDHSPLTPHRRKRITIPPLNHPPG